MRALVCPDTFTGTMTAIEAAAAIAAGWRAAWSDAEPDADTGAGARADLIIDIAPMSDGGPGFADIVAASRQPAEPVSELTVEAAGPSGRPLSIRVPVVVDDDGMATAIVESARCCGLALLDEGERDPLRTTSAPLGAALSAVAAAGIPRAVIGLGGTGTVDGGAGLLSALGARARDARGTEVPLDRGGAALVDVASLDLAPALARLGGLRLVAACDVDVPLTGPAGAAEGFARQKGADEEGVAVLGRALAAWAGIGPKGLADLPGAGAAGGIGFALALLGGRLESGAAAVAGHVGLPERIGAADVVVTGEGALDWQTRRGKVVAVVADLALGSGCPVVVLAGRVDLGRRELAAMGVASAHGLATGIDAPSGSPADLAHLAERIARRWIPSRNSAPPGA